MNDTCTDAAATYPPSPEFAAQANGTADLYWEADVDRLGFWAKQAARLSWETPFTDVLDWSEAPVAKWFVGGKLNVAYNCVDRHVEAGNGDRVAIRWEGEPVGDSRDITYAELLVEVSRAANALTELGLVAGDRVAIYMPMIPEAIIAMLACARLGVMHSVVFAGYLGVGAAGTDRRRRGQAGDHHRRPVPARGGGIAERGCRRGDFGPRPRFEHTLVVRRTGIDIAVDRGPGSLVARDRRFGQAEHSPEAFDSEHPLFLLYTSGTTGKPKGIVHTSGGYLTQASYTHHHVFDIKPETDVYWCTADIGWVTGHTYIVYGPLSQRRHAGGLRGHPDLADRAPAFRDHREVRRHHLLHGADADPHVHEVGPRDPGRARPVVACGCWVASVSRSTPRRGAGTGTSSAATRPRSSTPGGRPRPARS